MSEWLCVWEIEGMSNPFAWTGCDTKSIFVQSIYLKFKVSLLLDRLLTKLKKAQLAGVREFTDCISAEG